MHDEEEDTLEASIIMSKSRGGSKKRRPGMVKHPETDAWSSSSSSKWAVVVGVGMVVVGAMVLRYPTKTKSRPIDDDEIVGEMEFMGMMQREAGRIPVDPAVKPTPGVYVGPPSAKLSRYAIQHYLNPVFFEDPEFFWGVGSRLRDGHIVELRDAFIPSFADGIHAEIDAFKESDWIIERDDHGLFMGYMYHKRRIKDAETVLAGPNLRRFYDVIDDDDTKDFIHTLTGRDCKGRIMGGPALFLPGDFVAPHNDWVDQRTVAFVWHLAKDWRPEWGGVLHWPGASTYESGFHPATYNTLYIFSVRANSVHSVTPVSDHARRKRLSISGWWMSPWLPTSIDDVDHILANATSRKLITDSQRDAIYPIVMDALATRNLTRSQLRRIYHRLQHTDVDF